MNKSATISIHTKSTQKLHGATSEDNVESLLDQIGQGFQKDDATNLEKLNIARMYGPLLLQLKAIVPHGQFKQVLKKRFPKVSYSKCNRWMVIARQESQVAEVLMAYPNVAWGPKKMMDFLAKERQQDLDLNENTEDLRVEIAEESHPPLSPNAGASPPQEELVDLNEEKDYRSRWEQLISAAESEVQLIGMPPEKPKPQGHLVITVFSNEALITAEDALDGLQPKRVPVLGRKAVTNLTATVPPISIPDVLFKLAKTWKKDLPSQLKVNIEL